MAMCKEDHLAQCEMIAKLMEEFPLGMFVPATEFFGRPNGGIWVKGKFAIDGVPAFSGDKGFGLYRNCAHPKMYDFLFANGWRVEHYDVYTDTFLLFQ